MKYIVMVNIYTEIRDDYITAEYSGIRHDTREAAQKELEEAQETAYYAYIRMEG